MTEWQVVPRNRGPPLLIHVIASGALEETVPVRAHCAPGHLQMTLPKFARNAIRGLTDDLQPVKSRRLQRGISEIVWTTWASLADQLETLDDVEQGILVSAQSGTASASTRSRSRGLI